jgi:Mechanosensitive ion channel
VPRRYPLKGWIIGILSGLAALAALIIGSIYGNVHASTVNPQIIAWACAAALVVFGVVATARLSLALGHLAARQSVPAAEGAVRFLSSAVGYLIVLFGTFGVLDVSVQRLIVGAGLAGVVLGIAAQQSLGNIFAGLVLILARPFVVGDHIRIRSGALGGMFDAWVQEMSLTYVTVQTDDGQFKIPNTAMLAAGVGPVPPGNGTSTLPKPYGAKPATAEPTSATLTAAGPIATNPDAANAAAAGPIATNPDAANPDAPNPGVARPSPAGPGGGTGTAKSGP